MSATKIYVGNLGWNTTDESLQTGFIQFGNVVESLVMRDHETGRTRGFGYVTFKNNDEADRAIKGMNAKQFEGRRVKVHFASTGADAQSFVPGPQKSVKVPVTSLKPSRCPPLPLPLSRQTKQLSRPSGLFSILSSSSSITGFSIFGAAICTSLFFFVLTRN